MMTGLSHILFILSSSADVKFRSEALHIISAAEHSEISMQQHKPTYLSD